MPIEVDNDASRAAERNRTEAWLDRVEASVDIAFASLLSAERSPLLRFAGEVDAACHETAALDSAPHIAERLGALRKRLTVLQLLIRQAAAFEQGHRQWETESILGYTPKGLERAL